ncbi:MAG TPA: L-threonylcarbamoyladenylate synthase [Bacteroidales bacterium]|jgi:tRNA threonylcarbamoyl adenosine modification protein (Sua5/YciO/YrdC/YwlC family)|nr:L-threonylcarbamoyladenylate synthase [Bacteroidales bacterium]
MLLKIHPETPGQRQIQKAVEMLKDGGVLVFPTETVYGLGCDIYSNKAVERVARIKGINIEKANFSFICHSLSQLTDYAKHVNNTTFKLMKQCLPGPFTFILEASSNVPRIFRSRKKTIGIRIPDNLIITELVRELGNAILTTSIHDKDELLDYTTDPELIYDDYQNLVDAVINGGYGKNVPSTVIDCTGHVPLIVRQGIGVVDL